MDNEDTPHAEDWPALPSPPPKDPFDEDGYCAYCGNGSWKFHAPWCSWADYDHEPTQPNQR